MVLMALATSHQHPAISNQDGSNPNLDSADDETTSKVNKSRSECQKLRTRQGTAALMLRSNEHLRASCEDQTRVASITAACVTVSASDSSNVGSVLNDETANKYAAGAVEIGESKVEGKTASRPTSSCSSGSSSSSSDIQQHLQSMFCLLRPEETLKMAVKLESLRTGRTRYLVVVSRTVTSKRHNTGTLYLTGNGSASTSSSNISSWPLSATPVTITTTPTTAQYFGRTCSELSGTVIAAHMRHGSSTSETFAGIDTFVSSLNNCVLNVGTTINSARLPNEHVPCRSDQCDSKNNSRLINSTATADMAPSSNSTDTAGELLLTPDPNELMLSDKGDCSHESASAFSQEELHPQQYQNQHSTSNSAITVEGGKKIEESCLLGIDCNERTTVGLVLKVLADTSIRLDGDGGFSVSSCGKQHIFKPVSVQAMWSALQTLHKASFKAREHNFFAGGPSHDWVSYYEAHIDSDRSCLNEWNAMDSLESRRPPSPGSIRSKPTEREETESVIRSKLKEVMMSVDLDDVTSKFIRGRLEELLDMDLGEYKPFIDAEMLVILGQMDAPTEIFDHVYLGSEWNASNLEELQRNGVHHILNVTREIDNFFPGLFHYCNVRVYDDEKTDLLRHWDNTFKFISRAKMEGSKVLVHCKMGISRSASVVIAYAMKANGWNFEHALRHVKEKRNCIKPNKNFLMQLETYQGMLDAMKNKEKLQRSKSETNLKLAGAKEGRSLPGSEPTPLIQALNGAGGKKQTANGVLMSTIGKAIDNAEVEVDLASVATGADVAFTAASEGSDEGDAGPGRGRSRTRQTKLEDAAQTLNVKQYVLPDGSPQSQPEQQTSLPENPSLRTRHNKIMTNLFLPAAAIKMFNPCEGRICTRGSGALKRHKSLSPDSLNTRWSGNYDFDASSLAYSEQSFPATARASRTRTMLELDNQAEPYVVTGPTGGGRRKQQSYSLEHLHGGALEMRSPCTETKTIRMPCGNGQNYSVSPNQIVHLQDKLPANDVRKPVSSSLATTAAASTLTTTRTASFLARKLFPGGIGTNEQGADGSSQSLIAKVPSTVSLSSSTLGGSTVKTIVNELECNSSSNIPVAPPPLLTDPGTILSTVVPIPIASMAAEAAAVAVASAIREATRKDVPESKDVKTPATPLQVSLDAKGNYRTNQQWDPGEATASLADDTDEPICWTSSAQIIQQCPTPGFTEPTPVKGANSSIEHCEGTPETETGNCSNSKSSREDIMRQCSWSSCDSSCTGTDESRTGSYIGCISQRRLTASGQPCAVNSNNSTAAVIEEREEIPWHPGTVELWTKRIEQQSTIVFSGTMKRSTPSAASTLLTPSASEEKSTAVVEYIAPAASSNAKPIDQQQSQKNPQEEMGHLESYPQTVRDRQGMVSSSYARLSASAPDSYNLYAEPGSQVETIGTNVISDPSPAKRQVKLYHQHSFTGTGDTVSRTVAPSTSYCSRVNFRAGIVDRRHQQELGDGVEEDTFNAGKVRNLKMSFEAKSNDRIQGPKKVRSLPSSPVAVHVSMGSQTKHTSAQPVTSSIVATSVSVTSSTSAMSTSSSSLLPGTVLGPTTSKHIHQSITPPEDVTVRDLVDRYEEQGPRTRITGSNSLSRTQRPRSVFEPLKKSAAGKPFPPTGGLLSHSTNHWRLDEFMRPPVPPLVRGLVIPQHSGTGGGGTVHYYNNSTGPPASGGNYNVQSGRLQPSGPNASANSNARNNNNTRITLQSGGSGDGGHALGTMGSKRPQQHGRTHPLAKINPSARHHHHHLHVHHHHLVHHQYNIGQLQQHHHIGTAPGSGVSGTTGPSATVTANAYNTM